MIPQVFQRAHVLGRGMNSDRIEQTRLYIATIIFKCNEETAELRDPLEPSSSDCDTRESSYLAARTRNKSIIVKRINKL